MLVKKESSCNFMSKIHKLALLVCVSLSIIVFVAGCKKKAQPKEDMEYAVNFILRNPGLSEQSKELTKKALALWKNGKVDAVPILIHAKLIYDSELNKNELNLSFFDETKDVEGIGIIEYHRNKNETFAIKESYPIYSPCIDEVVYLGFVPITIRSGHEKKDDKLWDKYVAEWETLIADKSRKRELIHRTRSWAEDLPPVLISLPDSITEVVIWVYDREGNMSNQMKLEPIIQRN